MTGQPFFHLESITAGGDCAVLRIAGEIDVYTAPIRAFTLHPSVAEAIAQDQRWQPALRAEGHDAASWCRHHELEETP